MPSYSKYVESVSDFVSHVMDWKNSKNEIPISFRGQKYKSWSTVPKIFRDDVRIYDHEKEVVRDLISIHPQEFKDDDTMFDRLVRMQHYGMPTRLLDVTINPLVALYFATEEYEKDKKLQDGKVQAFFINQADRKYYDSDQVSCMANLCNLTTTEKENFFEACEKGKNALNTSRPAQRILWFIRLEKPAFEAKIRPDNFDYPVFVKPKMSNRRIIAQSGAFLLFGKFTDEYKPPNLGVHAVYIRAKDKGPIRKELERLGIHGGSLFPEIDKAPEQIIKHYQSLHQNQSAD